MFAHVGGDFGESVGWRAGLSWVDADATGRAYEDVDALGVPVVAPDVGAIRSVVAPGGGFVVARGEQELADAVVAAARSGISEEAVSWVRARFDAGRMVREVAALYEELLACARKPSPAP